MPVFASMEAFDGDDIDASELETALDEAINGDELNVEELYNDYDEVKDVSGLVSALDCVDLTYLQAGNILESSFMDNVTKFYFYGYTNGACGYSKKENWIRASITTISSVVAKVKTDGTTTYDAVRATAKVDPDPGFKVKQYNFKLVHGDSTRYSVPDWSELTGGDRSCTISINGSVDTTKAISGGATFEYTWDPDGQSIDTETATRGFWWRCKPSSPSYDTSYSVKPYIVLKATSGTEKTNWVYPTLSYQKVFCKKYSRSMTCDTDKKVTLKFKNHKKVE